MAWEWVGATATAVVGVAGVTATWLTARGARKAQEASEARHFTEARRHDLTARRQVVYADFVAAVRRVLVFSELEWSHQQRDGAYRYDALEVAKQVGVAMELGEQVCLLADEALFDGTRAFINGLLFLTGTPKRGDHEFPGRLKRVRDDAVELLKVMSAGLQA